MVTSPFGLLNKNSRVRSLAASGSPSISMRSAGPTVTAGEGKHAAIQLDTAFGDQPLGVAAGAEARRARCAWRCARPCRRLVFPSKHRHSCPVSYQSGRGEASERRQRRLYAARAGGSGGRRRARRDSGRRGSRARRRGHRRGWKSQSRARRRHRACRGACDPRRREETRQSSGCRNAIST